MRLLAGVALAGLLLHPSGRDRKLEEYRRQAKAALFLPETMPAPAPHDFGVFHPMQGVAAHRVTFASQYGMRVPAIVYAPEHAHGKLPAIVIVAGHGGSKSTWYEVYAGLLYARLGAVVVTYDPVGEGERNAQHATDARAHDTVLPGAASPARMGGVMVGDVMGAVSYALSLPRVDRARVAVLGYSMGSFHAALAAGLDSRIKELVLSGGGDLDGNGGAWDSSSKVMCQGGPYKALSGLPDKGAVLYALHQRVGETLLLNGAEDKMLATPGHGAAFFEDLNARVARLGARRAMEYKFYPGVGHRPSWVNRDAVVWLHARLRFPLWPREGIAVLGETHVAEWAVKTGAHINKGYDGETTEGGVRAVGTGFPAPTSADLEAVPMGEWTAHEDEYTWQGLAGKILAAQGISGGVPEAVTPR